jgi:hypothetical protein
MTDYMENWQTISTRIRSLNEAAKLDALMRPGGNHTGSTAYLAQQCGEIFEALAGFRAAFRDRLPGAREVNRGLAGNSLVHLAAIESAMTFSLASTEQRVRSLTERALQHLQRSLDGGGNRGSKIAHSASVRSLG